MVKSVMNSTNGFEVNASSQSVQNNHSFCSEKMPPLPPCLTGAADLPPQNEHSFAEDDSSEKAIFKNLCHMSSAKEIDSQDSHSTNEDLDHPPRPESNAKSSTNGEITNSNDDSAVDSLSSRAEDLQIHEATDRQVNSSLKCGVEKTISNGSEIPPETDDQPLISSSSPCTHEFGEKTSKPELGESDRQTSELIKKQINEIEREINRRMQNKNVKKMDENEMAQLLIDHGFGNFVDASTFSSGEEAHQTPGHLYLNDEIVTKPTLDQLASSFNPPDLNNHESPLYGSNQNFIRTEFVPQKFDGAPRTIHPSYFMQQNQPSYYYPSPGVNRMGPNSTNFTPHFGSITVGSSPQHLINQQTLPTGVPTTPAFPPGYQPPPYYRGQFVNNPPYFHEPQPHQLQFSANNYHQSFQQASLTYDLMQSPPQATSPVFSPTAMPPVLSSITPEIAAALLQKLQQHNPSLLESIIEKSNLEPGANNENIQNKLSLANDNFSQHNLSSSSNAISTTHLPSQVSNEKSSPIVETKSNEKKATITKHEKKIQNPPKYSFYSASSNARKNGSGEKYEPGSLDEFDAVESVSSGSFVPRRPSMGSAYLLKNSEFEQHKNDPPIWKMRDSYLQRLERDDQRQRQFEIGDENSTNSEQQKLSEEPEETDQLLQGNSTFLDGGKLRTNSQNSCTDDVGDRLIIAPQRQKKINKKEVIVHEPAVLIEGILSRARYLGSTQLPVDRRPNKLSRMAQAQEAVNRVKVYNGEAPEGEIQPSTEIDLFISTEKIMVLNTDLQRISETDVRQDIFMDHPLRSISYIADIGDLVVLMVRRMPNGSGQTEQIEGGPKDDEDSESSQKNPRIICHVFESEEAGFIAQSIGQAFQVAYIEFLRANGIDDPNYLREIEYQEVLNSQELMGDELEMFSKKEAQRDVVIPKKVGEPLGIVVVESGWGSMLPAVVVANMAPGGPASRSNQLNIGDQIIGINGLSLVGLPLSKAQQQIKNVRSSTAVRLKVVPTPPVVEVRIRRPDTKYQLGFSVQNGVICSLLRGGIAERGGIRVGHRIIEINYQSVVAVQHERIVNMLATATGEIHMKTMPTSIFRLLTGQEVPNYI